MYSLKQLLNGYASKDEVGEKDIPTLSSRISVAQTGLYRGTYGPTKMHIESYQMAKELYNKLKPKMDNFITIEIPKVEKLLKDAGAPPIFD